MCKEPTSKGNDGAAAATLASYLKCFTKNDFSFIARLEKFGFSGDFYKDYASSVLLDVLSETKLQTLKIVFSLLSLIERAKIFDLIPPDSELASVWSELSKGD